LEVDLECPEELHDSHNDYPVHTSTGAREKSDGSAEDVRIPASVDERPASSTHVQYTQQQQQQQQRHLFKHDKNYSGADVVVYLRS